MPKLPEYNELVQVQVKKILPYGAFCTLDEYPGQEAFLHISEVAPRWIKNIHEFLHEGQRLVCKVHRVDPQKGQIDISLKRVTGAEAKRKVKLARQTKRADKLMEVCAKQSKATPKDIEEARRLLEAEYGDLMTALEEISTEGAAAIKDLKIQKKLAEVIVEVAQKSIKKAKAEMRSIIQVQSHSPRGIEDIKKALLSLKTPAGVEKMELHYLGAPRYQLTLVAEDFKTTKKASERIKAALEQEAKKAALVVEWQQQE